MKETQEEKSDNSTGVRGRAGTGDSVERTRVGLCLSVGFCDASLGTPSVGNPGVLPSSAEYLAAVTLRTHL